MGSQSKISMGKKDSSYSFLKLYLFTTVLIGKWLPFYVLLKITGGTLVIFAVVSFTTMLTFFLPYHYTKCGSKYGTNDTLSLCSPKKVPF